MFIPQKYNVNHNKEGRFSKAISVEYTADIVRRSMDGKVQVSDTHHRQF